MQRPRRKPESKLKRKQPGKPRTELRMQRLTLRLMLKQPELVPRAKLKMLSRRRRTPELMPRELETKQRRLKSAPLKSKRRPTPLLLPQGRRRQSGRSSKQR